MQEGRGEKTLAGIVFTDLDGTLLDHHTYSYEPARPALDALRRRAVPLVLCSSKTRAEMVELQRALGIRGPLISENGGGIFTTGDGLWEDLFPERVEGLPAVRFGAPYSKLCRVLAELAGELEADLRGFAAADERRVRQWTGLSPDQAHLARQRDFDEPFLWEPEPTPEQVSLAREWLARRGLRLTRGGRFWHLTGDNDKGRAVRWLLRRLADHVGRTVPSLALGDSENDLPMLEAVDAGVLVERPGRGHLSPRPASVRPVEGEGPVGWNRAVLEWLETLETVPKESDDG